MQRAIEEERYLDAAFIRDYAGAGLVRTPKMLRNIISRPAKFV